MGDTGKRHLLTLHGLWWMRSKMFLQTGTVMGEILLQISLIATVVVGLGRKAPGRRNPCDPHPTWCLSNCTAMTPLSPASSLPQLTSRVLLGGHPLRESTTPCLDFNRCSMGWPPA